MSSGRKGFDPEQFRPYHRYREQFSGRGGGDFFGGMGGDLGSMFTDLFGGRVPRGGPRRGADIESGLTLDFASAIRGTTLRLKPRGPNGDEVTVRVPPGAEDGKRLRVPGQGAPGTGGGPPGDLVLHIQVTPHEYFWREKDDLHVRLPVTPLEAFEGAKIRVPTIDGSVVMKLPAGAQSGQKIRLKGKGVVRKNQPPGDLYVHLLIQIPQDPAAEAALRELEKRMPSGDDLRAKVTL
ncbi:MAG: HSP40/DnaJ peptide-binding protein [Polyangiaceae bacterium]|nr:HSP40/DnaJ peptide-binding protein [Polyangiaceae bacterium]